MSYKIVSNNPSVRKNYDETCFVEGGFEDVLLKVRDLVHSGHELISHPLGASIRMFFSPYRSIVVGAKVKDKNNLYVETIENSIENYRKNMKDREPDIKNKKDYELIDEELLHSSLEEYKRLNNNTKNTMEVL